MTTPTPFLLIWFAEEQPGGAPTNVRVLRERDGAREEVHAAILQAIRNHFVGLDILERMNFTAAAAVVRNQIPTDRKVRSGDLGELLAAEYVEQLTSFRVPVRRLQHKDDRNTTLRGDDVMAIRTQDGRLQVLKGEAKSRARLSRGVVAEAVGALMAYSGRPNPSTLAFLSTALRREGRDEEAELFESLQTRTLRDRDIEHLVFTVSGNDPYEMLAEHAVSEIRRQLVGMVIVDHQAFIQAIYEAVDAEAP